MFYECCLCKWKIDCCHVVRDNRSTTLTLCSELVTYLGICWKDGGDLHLCVSAGKMVMAFICANGRLIVVQSVGFVAVVLLKMMFGDCRFCNILVGLSLSFCTTCLFA